MKWNYYEYLTFPLSPVPDGILVLVERIMYGRITQSCLDLMEGLTSILNVEFLSNGAWEGRGWTANGTAWTRKAATVAHATAAR